MKQIPLTQGQFAIVDDGDFEWLSKYKWHAHWKKSAQSYYAERNKRTNGKQYHISMAREILGLKYGDKRQADHINHITVDNRSLNLRIASHQQNQWNRKNPKGYRWHKPARKYLASIRLNGKYKHLGYFQTADEAHGAYLRAKERYHKL